MDQEGPIKAFLGLDTDNKREKHFRGLRFGVGGVVGDVR